MAGHVINGDERRTVEDEIALLSMERGMIAGGFRVPRLLRRLRRTD